MIEKLNNIRTILFSPFGGRISDSTLCRILLSSLLDTIHITLRYFTAVGATGTLIRNAAGCPRSAKLI